MDNPDAAGNSKWVLPVCAVFLFVFLLLGAVYQYAPPCREYVQSYFPLFGSVSSELDEAAEELREGKGVKEAVQVFFHEVSRNAETDSH